MRNITISRKKSIVGAVVPFAVYAEDHTATERVILEKPCRMVGMLKNGEEVTFEIGDEETCVFVILQAQSFYPEIYRIPAGNTDMTLTGKLVNTPATGVSFRFDDNDTEEVRNMHKQRSKASIAGIALTVVFTVVLVLGILGRGTVKNCVNGSQEQTFAVQEMSITLDNTFRKDVQLGAAGYFHSSDAGIFVERVGFDEAEGLDALTAEEFAKFALIGGDYEDLTELKTDGDLPYFEFSGEDSASKESIRVFAAFYKSDDAFWDVQFITLEKDYIKMRPRFLKWAKSVTFDN